MKIAPLASLGLIAIAQPVDATAQGLCPALKAVTDASVQDFHSIQGSDGLSDSYSVAVVLPAASACKLGRALEKGFGELRYRCEYATLNYAAAGADSLEKNIEIIADKYIDFIVACRPDLTRKDTVTPWGKTTTFVDASGGRSLDVSRMPSFFVVEAFTASKNPNY